VYRQSLHTRLNCTEVKYTATKLHISPDKNITDMLTAVSSIQSLSTQRSTTNSTSYHVHAVSLARGLSQLQHLELGIGCPVS